jgi:hypothetical protein
MRLLAAMLVAASAPWAHADEAPRLSLPVACEIGRTCFIQNYVDVDPGPGTRDFACGGATYNGHNGVDFRLVSTAEARAGVAVLAAADGVVKGVRDGMTDAFIRDTGTEPVKGRECGNGLVLDHGGGWETQYCHMRKRSLTVAPGQRVARGERLGEVGYSGLVDFSHLHLTVRHGTATIDPFTRQPGDGACSEESARAGLWDEAAAAAMPYRRGEVIEVGFGTASPAWTELETGAPRAEPSAAAEALVFFARLIKLKRGDELRLVVSGPSGVIADQTLPPLDGDKAIHIASIGARRPGAAWPAGPYEGRASLLRAGAELAAMTVTFELR